MEVARRGAVGHLAVLFLPVEVRVVVDKVVPAHGLVLGGLQLEGRDLLHRGVALVITRVEHQDLEARDGQSGCERTATRAGPHDYVIVVGGLGRTLMGIVSMVVVPIASVSARFCPPVQLRVPSAPTRRAHQTTRTEWTTVPALRRHAWPQQKLKQEQTTNTNTEKKAT